MLNPKKSDNNVKHAFYRQNQGKALLAVYGEEMLERKVRLDGASGRLYLPKEWVGCHVKIIRLN